MTDTISKHGGTTKFITIEIILSIFVADFFWISSDEHEYRFQESSLRQRQIPDAALRGSIKNTTAKDRRNKIHNSNETIVRTTKECSWRRPIEWTGPCDVAIHHVNCRPVRRATAITGSKFGNIA
ncbi:hypothetical protein J6590_063344 [Homalodisca vitripennis]|nr:hypothetical protein J6590_063344 [Homalodisca vitripennis]